MARSKTDFKCESAEFNGAQCKVQCSRCAPKKPARPKSEWWLDYEIRTGGDGKVGIYLREYNVRLATFNANTAALQTRLKLLFNRAAGAAKRKARKRAVVNEAWGPGSGNW